MDDAAPSQLPTSTSMTTAARARSNSIFSFMSGPPGGGGGGEGAPSIRNPPSYANSIRRRSQSGKRPSLGDDVPSEEHLESRSRVLRGPILKMMAAHYICYGLLPVIKNSIEDRTYSGAVTPYWVMAFIAFTITRLGCLTRYQEIITLGSSFLPYSIFHLTSREDHETWSICWMVSLIFINLQTSSRELRRNIFCCCAFFIVAYITCSAVLFGVISSGNSKLIAFRPMRQPFNIYREVTCVIGLVTVSYALLRMQKFIDQYASNLVDQESHLSILRKANAKLNRQLLRLKPDIAPLDLDSPMTKVISVLRKMQEATTDTNVAEALDDAIYVLASNQLYQPVINKEALDSDINVWLNSVMNYRQQSTPDRSENAHSHDSIRGQFSSVPQVVSVTNLVGRDIPGLNFDSWDDFDVFKFADMVGGHPLANLGKILLDRTQLASLFQIEHDTIINFFTRIEGLYLNNPYHNALHGADVLQSMHCFLHTMKVADMLTPEDRLACLIAAACHDVEHPGLNNAFLVNTGSPLALRYNDMAVLENFHCARTFEVLFGEPECNVLKSLASDKVARVRAVILSTIQATDMSMHFEYITRFKNKLSGDGIDRENIKDRQLVLDVMMKCSDISNPAKPGDISQRWTDRVMEEFFLQGDEEARRGIPISMFMNRHTTNVPKCQIGFIDFIVRPLFEPWDRFINDAELRFRGLDNIAANKDYWKGKLDAAETKQPEQQQQLQPPTNPPPQSKP